jgi:hypothetical protein
MTPFGSTSNSLPRQVTREVKKLRSQTQQINPSRTGKSHKSASNERWSRNRCLKWSVSRKMIVTTR